MGSGSSRRPEGREEGRTVFPEPVVTGVVGKATTAETLVMGGSGPERPRPVRSSPSVPQPVPHWTTQGWAGTCGQLGSGSGHSK